MIAYRHYKSSDKMVYRQSVALRNRDLYRPISMPNLSEDGRKIEKDNNFFGAFDGEKLVAQFLSFETANASTSVSMMKW